MTPTLPFRRTGCLPRHLPFGIYFVVGLFALAKYANGVVCFTSTARAGSVALINKLGYEVRLF